MTDRPIIFSAPMVRALLDGRKTMTRRLQFDARGRLTTWGKLAQEWERGERDQRVWVREAWGMNHYEYERGPIPKTRPRKLDSAHFVYFATEDDPEINAELRRRPSIHMPRWASRITLDVTGVNVERLNEISEADAIAEGVSIPAAPDGSMLIEIAPNSPLSYAEPRQAGETIDEFIARALTARTLFAALWEKLHGPNTWTASPWVVAISFTVEHRNIDR